MLEALENTGGLVNKAKYMLMSQIDEENSCHGDAQHRRVGINQDGEHSEVGVADSHGHDAFIVMGTDLQYDGNSIQGDACNETQRHVTSLLNTPGSCKFEPDAEK